ncbi:trans-sialidase, partial [Trypanosoma rangeli]
MPRHVFLSSAVLLLFLFVPLLARGSSEAASAEGTESKEVELFKPREDVVPADGEEEGIEARYKSASSFQGHSLVEADGVMVALALAAYNDDGRYGTYTDMWAKWHPYGGGSKMPKDAAWDNHWKTELVTEPSAEEGRGGPLLSSKAVVRGNKIFVLASNPTVITNGASGLETYWGLELIVGEVRKTAENDVNQVSWKKTSLPRSTHEAPMQQHSWERLGAVDGSRGVAVGGSTIVFPLLATKRAYEGNEGEGITACTVIYSDDNGVSWKFPAQAAIANDCAFARLLEWEGKLLMVTAAPFSSSWRPRVYESADNGKTWAEASGPLSHLLSESNVFSARNGRFDLVTTTIEEKTVLLCTEVVFIDNIQGGINQLGDVRSAIHVWLSDGARIYDVGPISVDDAGFSFSTLLHAKDGLFALYSKEGEHEMPGSFVFKPLTEQLRHIKTVLSKWKEVDDRVSKLCGSTTTAAMKDGAEGAGCVGPLPTAGLIGFLSNNASDTHWNDEYFGVGATVPTGTKKVENGFQLAGHGARIAWPVGRQGPNSVRSYVGEELTLVATVIIDKVPTAATPLLGVSTVGDPNGKYLGLWYDERRHWKTRF